MWVFTPDGFYSAVLTPKGDRMQIRARVASDLDTLRDKYLPELTETVESHDTDYRYRGYCSREDWATAVAQMALTIDYANFKDEVDRVQGPRRHAVYGRVWSALLELQPFDYYEFDGDGYVLHEFPPAKKMGGRRVKS